jgi:hypothetical protein
VPPLWSRLIVGGIFAVGGFGVAVDQCWAWVGWTNSGCPTGSACPILLPLWLDPLFYGSIAIGLVGSAMIVLSARALRRSGWIPNNGDES